MSTYRNAKRDVAIADDYLANHLPCRFCGMQTPREDLENLGTRCRQCYDAYRAELNPRWWPNRPLTGSERAAVIRKAVEGLKAFRGVSRDPRAWRRRLIDRLEAGERLTIAQREALGDVAVVEQQP